MARRLLREPVPACHDVPMRSFGIKVLVNGIALWVAAFLLTGIHLEGGGASMNRQVMMVLWVAVIFALVNALIKPVMTFFSLPVIILTLGLFALVVNAAMLQLTSWFAGQFNLAFHVDHFVWDALLGSIIITFVSMILHMFLPDD